jgi:hypothetical protein
MHMRIFQTTIAITALSAAYSGTARAQDRCELYPDPALAGTKVTMTLPAVTATKATGSPLGSVWANTSERYTSGQLGSLDNKTSSAKILATESDVALYFLDSAQFSGNGTVYQCKKGHWCTIDLGSSMNDKTSSAICQREFFRKSKFTSTVVDPSLDYFQFLANPVIDMKLVSDAVDAVAESMIGGVSGLDAYRSTNSEDGYSLWSRTTWLTNYDHCKRFGYTNCQTTADKFQDLMRISKRFEIDVDNTWVDINPFMDDDYVIEADWYVRPVIKDTDSNPATPNELQFHWATREWWVEGGDLRDEVWNAVVPLLQGVDIQGSLRTGALLIMSTTGCATCIDGKERLQFSIYTNSNMGRVNWSESFNMDTTHPKMALNLNRDAVYPD